MVIVNTDVFQGLPEDHQQALLEAAESAEARGWAKAEELAEWYKEQLATNGMTVQEPGEQLKADFEEIGKKMTGEWLAETGETGQQVIDAYKSM
jgi:TRAP-type C4-dicarboxylate transport system substrate-binding protein